MLNTLDIVLITIGSVFLILTLCLVSLAGIFWYKRKQRLEKNRFFNAQPIHPIEDGHGKFDGFPGDDDRRIHRPNRIDIPGSLFGTEATAEKALSYDTNIRVDEFCARVKEYHDKDDTVFHDEFEVLNRQSGWGGVERVRSVIGDSEENSKRNRFLDVLPFEENRVKLSTLKGTDYINASYVDSYDRPKYFIATQGPLGEAEASVSSGRRVATVDDFWTMVWEKEIHTIIMLTQCVENCRPKCAQYWPGNLGETMKCGEIEIDWITTSEDSICFHREFDVRMGDVTKEISQFHFKEWEDSKAPESREHLLDFVENIRQTRKKQPVLVHCSAGVGRTGVFIALYNLLSQLDDPKSSHVDVFKTVSKLREQRVRMVQTPEQYVTLYDTLEAAIQTKKGGSSSTHRVKTSDSMHDSETQSETESVPSREHSKI